MKINNISDINNITILGTGRIGGKKVATFFYNNDPELRRISYIDELIDEK